MADELIETDVGWMTYPQGDVVTEYVKANKTWEPEEAFVLREYLKPNQIFVDVGAHVGYFTRLAASLGCTVISLEPAKDNFRLLCGNVSDLKNVFPMRLALSDVSAQMRYLYTSNINSGDNRFVPFDNSEQETVFVTTLPSIIKHAHFVKVDAQGDDYYIVAGMAGGFYENILVEHWPEGIRGIEPDDVLKRYERMGYSLDKVGDDSKGYCSYLLTPNFTVERNSDE